MNSDSCACRRLARVLWLFGTANILFFTAAAASHPSVIPPNAGISIALRAGSEALLSKDAGDQIR